MIAMTPEQLIALKAQIAEAEAAYHNLQLGLSARVVVDSNGERVEFTAANRADLALYIQKLKSQLPVEEMCFNPAAYAPMNFLF